MPYLSYVRAVQYHQRKKGRGVVEKGEKEKQGCGFPRDLWTLSSTTKEGKEEGKARRGGEPGPRQHARSTRGHESLDKEGEGRGVLDPRVGFLEHRDRKKEEGEKKLREKKKKP